MTPVPALVAISTGLVAAIVALVVLNIFAIVFGLSFLRAQRAARVTPGGQLEVPGKPVKSLSRRDFFRRSLLTSLMELRPSFVHDPLFMYEVAERIKVKAGGASLGEVYDPYFDRAPQHFSGHMNTANQPDPSGFDAGSEKGGFLYLAHPIFTAYKRVGAAAMLEIAEKAIDRALNAPRTIQTSLPRAGRATLRRQAHEKRDVLHLLYATPVLRGVVRGEQVQPIQELVTLHDVDVSLATERKPKAVRLCARGTDSLPLPAPVDAVHGAGSDRARCRRNRVLDFFSDHFAVCSAGAGDEIGEQSLSDVSKGEKLSAWALTKWPGRHSTSASSARRETALIASARAVKSRPSSLAPVMRLPGMGSAERRSCE